MLFVLHYTCLITVVFYLQNNIFTELHTLETVDEGPEAIIAPLYLVSPL